MDSLTVPQAILLSSTITVIVTVSSAALTRLFVLPNRRRKIRAFLLYEISEMIALTDRNEFTEALCMVSSGRWKRLPRVLDAALPNEASFDLFLGNIDLFSHREVELIGRFFRRLKACRTACASLCDIDLEDGQAKRLAAMAQNEWERATSTSEQIKQEIHVS